MPRKEARPSPIWVRANPLGLSALQIAGIRTTRHLTDLDIPQLVYRALLRAGHRYAGEFPYLRAEDIATLPDMGTRKLYALRLTLEGIGIRIGVLARDRVYAPTEAGLGHEH